MAEVTFTLKITVRTDGEPEESVEHWLINQVYGIEDVESVESIDG